MDVIIVGVTHAFGRHCIGGLELATGRRVRLVPIPTGPGDTYIAESHQFWPTDHNYVPGTTWRITGRVPGIMHPPHTENYIVTQSERLGQQDVVSYMINQPQSWQGNMVEVFDQRLHISNGKMYTMENDPPRQSTGEWRSDRDFCLQTVAGEHRYAFTARDQTCSVKYVGVQAPVGAIQRGTIIRFSLAKPFTPYGANEQRCYLQLSGWFQTI